MMEWNNLYGAILIDRDYDRSKEFIANEMINKRYGYFHPSLFSLPLKIYPHYYDNILISFGMTGKCILDNEDELRGFIKEFEDILRNLDFISTQVHVNATYAEYHLFWVNRQKLKKRDHRLNVAIKYLNENEVRFVETEDFYFGIGEVDLHTGWISRKYDIEKLRDFDQKYPRFTYP